MTNRKTKLTAAFLTTAVLVTAIFNATKASNHQQHDQSNQHQHHQTTALPPLLIDGEKNPVAVPDLIAYEFLLNSVADGALTSNQDRARAKIFADKTGLNPQNLNSLAAIANSFKQGIDPLNMQVKALKDRHWPYPSQAVMDQLANLQKQKESVLKARFDALLIQLDKGEKEKLDKRILEIKRKVKIYQGTPVEKYQKR
jgi:hypothetical protein